MDLKTRLMLGFMYKFPRRYLQLGLKLFNSISSSGDLLDARIFKEEELNSFSSLQHEANYLEVLNWLQDPLNQLVTFSDAAYPASLKNLKDPPSILFLRGNTQLLSQPQLAVVGSRTPSVYGMQIAENWVSQLARHVVITSGFAYGVDFLAHQSALNSGGSTIAVLGSGLIKAYPRAHLALFTKPVLETRALLVSEFPLSCEVQPWFFPFRNRVISALSNLVLVVEAKLKSGSLITARLAAEQGVDVAAIPGSIFNPSSEGCNYLIQQGAALVTSTLDVLQLLTSSGATIINTPSEEKTCLALEPEAQKLLDYIMFGEENGIDDLMARSHLNLLQLKNNLALLEEAGLIRRLASGYMRLK